MRSEKQEAWAKTQSAYALRVTGFDLSPTGGFATDFDPAPVLDAAPIPSSPNTYEHQAAWAEVKRLFEEHWRGC